MQFVPSIASGQNAAFTGNIELDGDMDFFKASQCVIDSGLLKATTDYEYFVAYFKLIFQGWDKITSINLTRVSDSRLYNDKSALFKTRQGLTVFKECIDEIFHITQVRQIYGDIVATKPA